MYKVDKVGKRKERKDMACMQIWYELKMNMNMKQAGSSKHDQNGEINKEIHNCINITDMTQDRQRWTEERRCINNQVRS